VSSGFKASGRSLSPCVQPPTPQEHQSSWPFLEAVDELQAPEYYKIIKFPMDLHTMTERLKSGYYSCVRLFIADMRRILANCKMYNERNTDYYRCAIALEKFYVSKMKEASIWMELS